MTTTPHAITIDRIKWHSGTTQPLFVARCSCGWTSAECVTEVAAKVRGDFHCTEARNANRAEELAADDH